MKVRPRVLLLKAEKILGRDAVRNGFYGQEFNITTYNLCRINMFLHDIGFDKFDIACEDTLTAPQHWDDEPFELIVSNPPYIPTDDIEDLMREVKDHEPHLALDGSRDGLHFYRKLAEESGRYLVPGGSLLFEIGYDQGKAVSQLLDQAGFKDIHVKKDLAGLDRVVYAVKAAEDGGK